MIREYKTVEEISGPLMMVRMVENVTYDELVEVELKDGAIRWAVTRDAVTEAMLRDVFGPELRLAEVDGEKVVLHRRAV